MAAASSVGALPFSVEGSKERNKTSLSIRPTPLVRFSHRSSTTSSWPRGGGIGTTTTVPRGHLLGGVSSRRVLSLSRGAEIGGVRVAFRKKIVVKALTVDDDGTEDLGDDQLNAAIQKSKNVLKVQKDLLQQIIERRKHVSSVNTTDNREKDGSLSDVGSRQVPVSSVNDTSLNKEKDVSSTDGRFINPLPDFDIAVRSVYLDQAHNSTSAAQENQGAKSVGETIKGERDYLNESTVGTSVADALGLSREIGPSTTSREADSTLGKSKVLPNLPGNYGSQVTIPSGSSDEDVAKGSDANDSASAEGSGNSTPSAGKNVMNIILAAAECAPWSKTGGLGDVAGALPKALSKRGHRVMVVVPRYGNYADQQEIGIRRRYKVAGQDMEISYFHAYIDGVDFVFIDSPIFSHRENNIYGGERQDILKRMVLFCKAAVEAPWHVPCGGVCYGDGNLVFIANDWHTALLPVYLKAYYRDNGLMKYTRSVLVIHNIAHQGRGPLDDFNLTDLPDHYSDLFRIHDPVGGEHFNIFAAGLKTADRIVTVSHGYTWELKTLEGGWGLHEIINKNDWKLQGIVNGIDTKDWNPELDIYLKDDGYTNFSLETLKKGKAQCKAALQKELGLPVRDNVPLIGFIGRLDHQKGVDLIAEAIPWMVSQDMQLVMLGTGRADLEEMLRRFEGQYNDKVRGWVGFSVKTAHRITAGADILLMPSRFEPCGLNQLYAMKYGTIPVVHAVGGLRDTVIQFDPFNNTGYGWTFNRAEANKLIEALGHCFNTYWNYKSSWEGLQTRGMMQDLSWENAAQNYEEALLKAKYQW